MVLIYRIIFKIKFQKIEKIKLIIYKENTSNGNKIGNGKHGVDLQNYFFRIPKIKKKIKVEKNIKEFVFRGNGNGIGNMVRG